MQGKSLKHLKLNEPTKALLVQLSRCKKLPLSLYNLLSDSTVVITGAAPDVPAAMVAAPALSAADSIPTSAGSTPMIGTDICLPLPSWG